LVVCAVRVGMNAPDGDDVAGEEIILDQKEKQKSDQEIGEIEANLLVHGDLLSLWCEMIMCRTGTACPGTISGNAS
jgi:hypothetical protein